jgi:prepilin-type N-terminal cleavage/methylation domain-containing protein
MRRPRAASSAAFTLLEVLIASTILAIVLLGAITGLLFVSRMSLAAQQDLMAMEVLERESELIRAAPNYAALGDTDRTGPHPTNPVYPDQSFTDERLRVYDPQFPDSAPTFALNYTWYGFGEATSGSGDSLSFDENDWPEGVDMTGRFVILRAGPGAGQIARITSHTAGQFELDAAFNGYAISDLLVPPGSGTRFEVDGGKWVRVTARWRPTPNDPERVAERILFISNRAAAENTP